MRIVSLNCWGGRPHPERQLEFLAKIDADVYCLQEVYAAPAEVPVSMTFAGQPELPVRPHLFDEIAAVLPLHRGYFYPAARGYLGDGAVVKEGILYGIASFVRKDIPILAERMKFVFESFRFGGWGEPPLPRNAHGLRLLCPKSGKVTVLVHLHGLWQPNGKQDTPERLSQGLALRGLVMHMVENRDDRVVVCGDFNLLPDSKTFTHLADFVPRNLIVERSITGTRTSFYKKSVSRYADYALVSAQVEVRRFEAVESPEVSDHRPLLIDIA